MEPLTKVQQRALMARLDPGRVKKRSQGGRQLSYLESWDVKASLIRIFGYGGFNAEVIESKVLRMSQDAPAYSGSGKSRTLKFDQAGNQVYNWSVATMSTVRLTVHQLGCVYTETAIASQTGPDVGEVADFAQKTSSSDALKRCAVYLGTQFGMSLYNNGDVVDVVKVVMAPGQEWANNAPVNVEDQSQDPADEAQREQVEQATGTSQVTPEQRQENEALLRRAMSAKAQKDAQQEAAQEGEADEVGGHW